MKRLFRTGSSALVVAAFFVGCTTQHYRRSADREAYGVISQKTPLVKNMDPHFTINETNQLSLDGLPLAKEVEVALGLDSEAERDAPVLSLEKALAIAVNHSRIYQNQKEQLFLTALVLTLARHQFSPLFSAGAAATYTVNTADVLDYVPD